MTPNAGSTVRWSPWYLGKREQRGQAPNSTRTREGTRRNAPNLTTTGGAGGTMKGTPSRDANPIGEKGVRTGKSELRNLALGRSYMVSKGGKRRSLYVRTLPPRLPTPTATPSGASTRGATAGGKGKGTARVHDCRTASVAKGDDRIGASGTVHVFFL